MESLNVGIAGLGTVGQGVWKYLLDHAEPLGQRAGGKLVPYRAAVRSLEKRREVAIPSSQLTTDPMELATDPNIDILCELMGGVELARKVTLTALEHGKSVITANKAMICDHGAELFAAAERTGSRLYYEASTAGGIPIIKAVREGLVANQFPLIYGILNGTCNYILTRMEREQKTFEEIVVDARRLGYVEADESLDLDGWDTAHKTAILAFLAHGRWISMKEMPVEGIRDVTLDDLAWARELGYRVKLLAVITRHLKNNCIFADVHPTLIPEDFILANVDEVFNGVSVTGDIVGETTYIGRGAGQNPTASAVITDLVDATIDRLNGVTLPPHASRGPTPELARLDDVRRPFYLRLRVADRSGVLADIARIMAQHNISIEQLVQKPHREPDQAHLIMTTHTTSERQMRDAIRDLEADRAVQSKPLLLRILKV
ncbi:MAG: homoserine dehydrogenase [Verrucomicrobiota bacterium JB022]|nr:homoserine dehydrogenase [Verrucomicrobiota bacterium JB022]